MALSSLQEELTTSDGGIPWADSVSVFTEAINSQRVPQHRLSRLETTRTHSVI